MNHRRFPRHIQWICALLIAVMAAAFLPSIVQAGFWVPVTEYPATHDSPFMMVAGKDGNIWFTYYSSAEGYIGRITTAGVLTTYSVHTGAYDIANGPDEGGNHYIWWTESNSFAETDYVSKINTSTGAITSYSLLDGSGVSGITEGPDGAMWFTYTSRNMIGRITTAGSITEFEAPSSNILDITLGPDGNLWFTDWSRCAIGKITSSGTTSEYLIPMPLGCSPAFITTGPDGNLWFSFLNGFSGVGRITTAGVITLFTGNKGWQITSGPDGNLWVASSTTHILSRYTTKGKVTYYETPSVTAVPQGIVAGPDGNIWFTEDVANKVGKLEPQDLYPSVSEISITSVMNPGPTQFSVEFDDVVDDPPGDFAPEDVTNVNNYLLVNLGTNNNLDTVSCDGGVVTDDTGITVDSVTYDEDMRTATVSINGGTSLPNGYYALFVCGTTSIKNIVGNSLGGGNDFLARFMVGILPSNIPNTGFAPGKVTSLSPQPLSKSYSNQGDLWLEIPSLNVKLPIVGVPATRDGWDISWLGEKAGWLQGTAFPTWAGNSVLTGHAWNANDTPGPFIYLNQLAWGDKVIIHAWGQDYVYSVRSVKRISPNDTASVMKHESLPWLTLVTCQGYDVTTGSYRYRIEVKAVQVQIK